MPVRSVQTALKASINTDEQLVFLFYFCPLDGGVKVFHFPVTTQASLNKPIRL